MKTLFYIVTALISTTLWSVTTLQDLQDKQIINPNNEIKIHLGCGENKIAGYVNIDFPSEDHTVQTKRAADYFYDITKLSFPRNSIDEVRNHHVFEHFSRAKSLALLTAWHMWLKDGGVLHIETPDFQECIRSLIKDRLTYSEKQTIIRHIFGSQEAHWALHYDGWYTQKYRSIFRQMGFQIFNVKKECYKNLHNITVKAQKKTQLELSQLKKISKSILETSLVDHSESEMQMLEIWYSEYLRAIKDLGL